MCKKRTLIFCWLLATYQMLGSFEETMVRWSRPIAETFRIAQNRSLFQVDLDKAIAQSLDSFMKNIDKHGSFLAPQEYQDLIATTQGEFFGIGVLLHPPKKGNNALIIADFIPGSPADRQGLQKNDAIISIDGKPISSMGFDEAVQKLKGNERFSPLALEILRNGTKRIVHLNRDIVKEQAISCYYLPDQQIVYCSLSFFTNDVGKELREKLEKLKLKPLRGIIMDLRDNPGGVLRAAADCASIFLPKNSLVATTKTKEKQDTEKFFTEFIPLDIKAPLIILMNNLTASAGEILAGTLQHYAARQNNKNTPVFLAGAQSHGKGSVQEIIPISQQCAVKITTAFYYLPSGISINHRGLEPDFYLEPEAKSDHEEHPTKLQQIAKDPWIRSSITIINTLHQGFKLPQLTTTQSLKEWVKKQLVNNTELAIQEIS